ncbi:serine/threonine-protein kinase [Paraliomyxa miuraensis]|uniref:serine/threonine-protein kinase n=1 Tax=Paraliomyxa miuraensis TaxID=376150 RepID=UPI00224E5959|nr:serine/threonine-protein kinase [Paraliomyxa miuraensis]MCX4246742.1 protein kinase [Paraliomyxa miuraensis]
MHEPNRDDATLMAGEPRLLAPGSVFADRYVVEGPLGEGGMGSVHAVVDRELGERVALKVLGEGIQGRPEALERFRREVRVARRVTHRNAARTFDIGEYAGLRFLTMELVEGESLAQRLRRERRLDPSDVVEIGRQVCDGLGAVHEVGIVHRDLKPANVLLERTGRVVLTDFGIARPEADDDRVTQESSQMVGTPHYMAPEQVAGEPLTSRTDIYSLGLLLYEMATGRLPFMRGTTIATAVARLHDPPEPPQQHVSLPEPLVAAIMACLRREPAQRPADAAAVRAMLEAAPAESRTSGGSTDPDPKATDVTLLGASSSASCFCPVDVGEKGLAVLPLRHRGPADDAYVAEAITEQLIDLLSMTRGLRVPAAGATEPFAERRDPRAVREALGVDVVVDGTVQRSGSRLRVAIRLLDAQTGYQTWTDRFEGELRDVFELQDRIATKVAEALRLRVESSHLEVSVPPEALELYMRARAMMREHQLGGPEGAPALLARCLELAPKLPPALASYAIVCSRMWFFFGEDPWAARCEDAVARALVYGPHLPDTHLAAARMHGQRGEFAEAARALQQTLELAPTHAAAHAYLGVLQCEAGRSSEGLRHIELARDLAPSDRMPLIAAIRHLKLHGQDERADALIEQLMAEDPDAQTTLQIFHLRFAVWMRDLESIRRWRAAASPQARTILRFLVEVGGFVLGDLDEPGMMARFDEFAVPNTSRRYRALLEQMLVEGLLATGRVEPAVPVLERLADEVLVDVDWLEYCPLLHPLRDEPWMAPVRSKVRARARAIWALN